MTLCEFPQALREELGLPALPQGLPREAGRHEPTFLGGRQVRGRQSIAVSQVRNFCAGSGRMAAPGAVAWLRARAQPRRKHLEHLKRVEPRQTLLFQSGHTRPGLAARQRAPPSQARGHSGLLSPVRLPDVALAVRVSNFASASLWSRWGQRWKSMVGCARSGRCCRSTHSRR
jgi:hypothetical protein